MSELDLFTVVVLPVGLGLLGFIEPCSIGSTLIVIKYLEGRSAAAKFAEICIFTLVRAFFMGVLGLVAIMAGSAFIGFQKAAWMLLGALFAGIGLALISGRAGWLMVAIGPHLARILPVEGPVLMGLLFGLNVPACAAPLLIALLGAAAAGGAGGYPYYAGFISLALFGLALSAPLVLAILLAPMRHALDGLAGLSRRFPVWIGALLLALGTWAIGDAYVAEQPPGQQSLLERIEARKRAKQAHLRPEEGIPGRSGSRQVEHRRFSRYEAAPSDEPDSDSE